MFVIFSILQFSLLSPTLFRGVLTTPVSLEAKLLHAPNVNGFKLDVRVKNLSKNPMKVLKERRIDYKSKFCRSFGNYIIELQRSKSGQFSLVSPTGSIDPYFVEPDYVKILPGKTITDTLNIDGDIFAINHEKGLSKGIYRVRISFNSDEWSASVKDTSQWLSFKIE